MKFNALSGLACLLLAGQCHGLVSENFDTCSVDESATCQCPAISKCRPANYLPERFFPRTDDTCPNGSPPCCVERGPGPLKMSSSTSQTNLQCGQGFSDSDPQDVPNGVTYSVEDCPTSGKCLHIVLSPTSTVTVTDIHLQVDDDPITVNTGLGNWAFNSYCTESPSECWVPVSAVLDTFENPSASSLCGKTVYVAAGISISGDGGGATCFNQGPRISDTGNWFMYYALELECEEDVCQRKCCCASGPLRRRSHV